MVVDDDGDYCELVKGYLENEGHEIVTIGDPLRVWDEIIRFEPDLLILDVMMPKMNGLELLKSIRSQKHYVATIFASGRDLVSDIVEALNLGADDFVIKPFHQSELVARVKVRLRIKELQDRLNEANNKLEQLTVTDDLTGLLNMRSTYERIEYALKQAKRFSRRVACIMMDVDNFKAVNDQHDHLLGSFVLRELGTLIQKSIRDIDFAARYGGDEFLVVLTETNEIGAQQVCERIRQIIQNHSFRDRGFQIQVTVSIGYTISHRSDPLAAKELVILADQALLAAKVKGKNQVVKLI